MTRTAELAQPSPSRWRTYARFVAIGVIIVAIVAGAVWWIRANHLPDESTADDTAAQREEPSIATTFTESLAGVQEPLNTDDWQLYEQGAHGLLVRIPPGWDVEELTPSQRAPVGTVTRFGLNPRGQRYFREPEQIYPIVIDVLKQAESDVAQLYADHDEVADITTAAGVVTAGSLSDKNIVYVLHDTNDQGIVVVDQVGRITGLGDSERAQLRELATAAIATVMVYTP